MSVALTTALLGAGGNIASTAYNNRQAEKRQHEAQDFSAQQYATRYQTQVRDMKAAGLNPMLAAGASPGSSPQSSAASSTGHMDITGAAANAASTSAEVTKKKWESSNLEKTGFNLDGTWYAIANEVKKGQKEIENLEQLIKNNKATQDQILLHSELLKKQAAQVDSLIRVQEQQVNMNRPEEKASASSAADLAAEISRVLKPIIDAAGGAKRLGR